MEKIKILCRARSEISNKNQENFKKFIEKKENNLPISKVVLRKLAENPGFRKCS